MEKPAASRSFSSSRVTGTVVIYDIVICAVRGKSAEMEALRYRLYDALHAAGVFDAKTAIELAAFRGDAIERAALGKKAR